MITPQNVRTFLLAAILALVTMGVLAATGGLTWIRDQLSTPMPTPRVVRIERPQMQPGTVIAFSPSFWAHETNCAWGESVDVTLMPESTTQADTYNIKIFYKEGETVLDTFTHPPVMVEAGQSVRRTVNIKIPGTTYKEGRYFRIEITSTQFKFGGGFHCPS
jgi:hypothetical protein